MGELFPSYLKYLKIDEGTFMLLEVRFEVLQDPNKKTAIRTTQRLLVCFKIEKIKIHSVLEV
jgi:hypothetical protein